MQTSPYSKMLRATPSPVLLALLCASLAAVGCKKSNDSENADPEPAAAAAAKPAPDTAEPAGTNSLAAGAGTFEIDSGHSTVVFRIKHMGVAYFYGTFNKVTGTITADGDLTKSKLSISIDATSVFTADKKREAHIMSPDFLNAAQFPVVGFTSSSIESLGENKYSITGELELHGVKKSVTGSFLHVGTGPHMMDAKQVLTGFTGELTVKRTDFGMDKLVGPLGDEILLIISVEAGRTI